MFLLHHPPTLAVFVGMFLLFDEISNFLWTEHIDWYLKWIIGFAEGRESWGGSVLMEKFVFVYVLAGKKEIYVFRVFGKKLNSDLVHIVYIWVHHN